MAMRSGVLRAGILCVLTLVLSSCVAQRLDAVVGTIPEKPDYAFWPHEVSDLKHDPGITYGVLANGMRYAIMRGTQPAGAVSLRFRIAAGSVQERDDQRGLAHFLEHMAFNGSKNVPEGEFVKLLQRKGLAFGAHTNAYTSTNETVYMLELPRNTADLVDTGLMLFREVGENLLLDPKAIEREKGVVLAEQRSRNTPEYRALEARWKLWYEGQLLADRLPIGLKEAIEAATRETLLEYYQRNYRPERALLVVVGDIDVGEVQQKIERSFADWKGSGADRPDPQIGAPKSRGLTAAIVTEKNLPESVTVNWIGPASRDTDTAQSRSRDARWWMANAIVNRRLERLARGANAPFISAGVGYSRERGVGSSYALSVSSKPGTWRTALAAAEQELRRALEHGFSAAEIEREVKEWRAGLEDAVASAATRQSSRLAGSIVSGFDGRTVETSPADELALFGAYAPSLTPKNVQAGLREIATGFGPIVVVSSGDEIAAGSAAVTDAFTQSRRTQVAPLAERSALAFPYDKFGAAGKIAERRVIDDLGVSLLRFENGVRLNIKRTDFDKDTVSVTVRFAGGFLSLPRDRVGLYWMLPFAFNEGGLKKLTTDELEEALAGRIVSMSARLGEDAFIFSGGTNGKDLTLQLQLLAAFATDPAYRSEGLERQLASAEDDLKQFNSSPGRVLSREVSSLLRSRDPRWQFPTLGNLQSISMKDVEAVIGPALSSAPVEVSIVGDVTEEEAVRAVAGTFGALPSRPTAFSDPAGARAVSFPKGGGKYRFTHEGSPDQALAYVAWRGPGFYSDMRRARTLSLLREIIKVRLTDEFREAQGAAYSPTASASFSSVFPDFGFIAASSETKPELVEDFFRTVDEVVNEIVSGKLSDDAIERAREPLVKALEKNRLGNGFWVGAVADLQSDPRSVEAIRSQISDVSSVTRKEVVEAARAWLRSRERVEIRILPASSETGIQPKR
jgi:zinc protease